MKLTGKHIHDFIDSLPGANPTQYARLLNVSTSRITLFLSENRLGRDLVKQGKVKVNPRGIRPKWALPTTTRGLLLAHDVPAHHPSVTKACASLPEEYQRDVHHMFQMLVHMTSGNCGLAEAFTEISTPFVAVSVANSELGKKLEAYETTIARLERIVELQNTAIENNTKLLTAA